MFFNTSESIATMARGIETTSREPAEAAGYAWLTAHYAVVVMPNWHESSIGRGSVRTVIREGGRVCETFPARSRPKQTVGAQLEFALRYEGTNLAILSTVFGKVDPDELAVYIAATPNGKYTRRIWYLYETLTGRELPLEDIAGVSYLDLLDASEYYTVDRPRKSPRHRIHDNLPGDARFCPLVRRTDSLAAWESADLTKRIADTIARYPAELIRRAMSFMYLKETTSSFGIEHIEVKADRSDRFIAQLKHAEDQDYCNKAGLIELQNSIVEPRYAAHDYRDFQNYVGESINWQRQRVHYIAPRPDDLPELMEGLIACHARMRDGNVIPAVHAATLSYGFVYLHPFEDGNGRISRFLIHNVLAMRGYTPHGFIFPVSAAMLSRMNEYDASLEAFSEALMPLIEYSFNDDGSMTVQNETAVWYRFPDMTAQTEALYIFLEATITQDLAQELEFLLAYDRAREAVRDVVDMPDRRLDMFIRIVTDNHGRLSRNKRRRHFPELSDDEVNAMEEEVRGAFGMAEPQDADE